MKVYFATLAMSSLVFCNLAVGQDASTTATLPMPSQAPQQWGFVGGLKSYNDSGRNSDGTGRQLKSKNEYFGGGKNKAGWGGYVMFVETATQFSDSSKNRFSPSDPSLTLTHPIYSEGDTKITGQFREYFPVADFSQNRSLYQQAYYVNLNTKVAGGLDLFNQYIARNFSQTKYANTDTMYYMEDYTTLSRNLSDAVRLGFGQHAQMEWHNRTDAGSTVEAYPYADFMLSKSIFAGPRLFMPVWVQNSVNDAPKAVSMTNFQVELYLQATL